MAKTTITKGKYMANALAYFQSIEFANTSLEEFVDVIDHYLGQSDFYGDGTLEDAVFGMESKKYTGDGENITDFDITQFLRSDEAKAAYHTWCMNNAQERLESFEMGGEEY